MGGRKFFSVFVEDDTRGRSIPLGPTSGIDRLVKYLQYQVQQESEYMGEHPTGRLWDGPLMSVGIFGPP